MDPWRGILTFGADPAFNMGLDEALLVDASAPPTFRVYDRNVSVVRNWMKPALRDGSTEPEIVDLGRAGSYYVQLADADQHTRVLILTTFDLDEYVYDAVAAGASGFLLKDTPADDLVKAVRIVASGDALLAPSVTRRLIERFTSETSSYATAPGLDELTERETEVLSLMARGHSNQEIANLLFLGETTVKTHVSRVLMKLGVRDRVQAVIAAYESGLVRPGHSDST